MAAPRGSYLTFPGGYDAVLSLGSKRVLISLTSKSTLMAVAPPGKARYDPFGVVHGTRHEVGKIRI